MVKDLRQDRSSKTGALNLTGLVRTQIQEAENKYSQYFRI